MTEDISIYTYEFVLLLLNYFSSHTQSTKNYFLKHEKQDSEDDAKVVGLTEKMAVPQCGNFMIFLSVRFYVTSIFGILEVQNLPF